MKSKIKFGGYVAAGSLLLANLANAAVPAGVGATITALTADAQSVYDTVFPVIGLVVGLMVVTSLFKRFSKKI